jgi:putative DNA primase/helicase
MGSIAWVAAARAVWLVALDPEDPQRRLFLRVKCNLAPDPGGLAFRLQAEKGQPPRVVWDRGPVNANVHKVLNPEHQKTKREQAADWLRGILAHGPLLSKEIYKLAERQGIKRDTLLAAKEEIGGTVEKLSTGAWQWSL